MTSQTIPYQLYGARRPEQAEAGLLDAYEKFAEAQDDGRAIVRAAEEGETGITFVEVRYQSRMLWCAWVRPWRRA